jgi:hypothetical protein
VSSTLIDSLTLTDAERHAIFGEGWLVTDLLGHIGSWLAAANWFLDESSGSGRHQQAHHGDRIVQFVALIRGAIGEAGC